jgi:hypothetical protein
MRLKRRLAGVAVVLLAVTAWTSCIRLPRASHTPDIPHVVVLEDSGSLVSPWVLGVRGTDPDDSRLSYQASLRFSASDRLLTNWSSYASSGAEETLQFAVPDEVLLACTQQVCSVSVRSRNEMCDSSGFSSESALWFANAVLFGSVVIPGGANTLAYDSTTAFVGGGGSGLYVVDVSDSSRPHIVGSVLGLNPTRIAYSPSSAVVFALTLGAFDGTIHACDVSTPSDPAIVGSLTIEGASGMAVDSTRALVSTGFFGDYVVRVVDLRDPSSMVVAGMIDMGEPSDMEIHFPYGYMIVNNCLLVFDLSDPEAPRLVSAVNIANAGALCASGHDYVYVMAGSKLNVVNVADPASPVVVDSIETVGGERLSAADGFLAVASRTYGVTVHSLADPGRPARVGFLRAYEVKDVCCGSRLFCAANGPGGLYVGGYPLSLMNLKSGPRKGRNLLCR